MSSQLPPRLIGRYAGVPLGAGGGRRILTYSLGGRVCADWASLGLWGSLSLIFTLLAFLWLCGWGTWLLSAILCAPKCSGGWGEGRQTSGISPQSGGSVATSWEEAMGCPQFLAGSYLPTLAGAWGVDLRGGEPHGIRQTGGSLDHGEPDSKQPPSLLLSVPLSLFSGLSARGGGGRPSHMALECGLKQQDGHPRTKPRSLCSQPIGRMTHCHQCLQVPVDVPPVYNM